MGSGGGEGKDLIKNKKELDPSFLSHDSGCAVLQAN